MFDIGGAELLVIGVVALIVVGPKDLPGMFHTLGRFTAKARSMAREFSRAMNDAAKETGVGDVAKDLKGMTSAKGLGLDKMQQAVGKFEAWDPMKKTTPVAKGPATEALSAERAEAKAKIEKATAERALARKAAEATKAEAAADAAEHAPAPRPKAAAKAKPAPAPKPAAAKAAKPKVAPKATAAPKAAKPKAAPKAAAAPKPVASKPAPRKPAARKPAS
jgi:sec-independent protein translocase protein TatB